MAAGVSWRTLLVVGLLAAGPAQATEELNALVWCDHTDPALLEPFEKQFDVKVNVKDYEGTGTALALIEQSQPGDWDVFVVDSTDVRRVVGRKLTVEKQYQKFSAAHFLIFDDGHAERMGDFINKTMELHKMYLERLQEVLEEAKEILPAITGVGAAPARRQYENSTGTG